MSHLNGFLGKDIAFKSDFVLTASGDLDIIEGLDNLKESLFRRLMTSPGSVVHRPTYGIGIKNYQGALNSFSNQTKITNLIKQQFTEDPRIEQVLGVSFRSEDDKPDTLNILVRVSVKGYGEDLITFIPFGDE